MRRILAILTAVLVLGAGSFAQALSPALRERAAAQFRLLLMRKPEIIYVWGAADPYGLKGKKIPQADCSGYMDGVLGKIFRDAGFPVSRTTAFNMALGLQGWKGYRVELDDADECDLVFWSFDKKFDHVGAILVGPVTGLLQVTHASGGRKRVVLDEMRGNLVRKIGVVRRLSHGEKGRGNTKPPPSRKPAQN